MGIANRFQALFDRWPWLRHLRRFYTGSLIIWLFGIGVLDNNNIRVVWSNYQKMKDLERDKVYFTKKIKEVKRENNEVFGNQKLLEKWAREKYFMRKENEDVYVIVDENNKPIESNSNF